MRTTYFLLGLAASASTAYVRSASLSSPSRAAARSLPRMSTDGTPAPHIKVELLAARSAVGNLQRDQKQESVVGVPPQGSTPGPLSVAQRVRTPFIGLTVMAAVAVAGIQSKRLYNKKVERLLAEFAATMIAYLGDDRAMLSAFRSFRQQLGPGSFRVKMFTNFLVALVTEKPIGVATIQQLKKTVDVMALKEEAVAEGLSAAVAGLKSKPTMLGKLTFLAERAMPVAARQANLRAQFPNWKPETVSALQQAMLENLYREMCQSLPEGAPPPAGGDVLMLAASDCARLMKESQEKKKEALRIAAEDEAEKSRRSLLEETMRNSAGMGPDKGRLGE